MHDPSEPERAAPTGADPGASRRAFLRNAAAGAGSAAAAIAAVQATQPAQAAEPPKAAARPERGAMTIERPGSDFMVDVVKKLDLGFISANPGSSFRSLHESLVNYGGNSPELLTCLHEESSVAIAHGYAKAAGKPMGVFAHGTVGLQHASMAIYNAWCDRVPMMIFAGNGIDASKRRPGTEWSHSVQDAALRALELAGLDPANRALKEHYYALLDEKNAAEAAAAAVRAAANEHASLQERLWQIEGNTGALRDAALKKLLDDESRNLQKRIWAAEDEAAARQAAAAAAQAAASAAAQWARDQALVVQ